MNKFIPLTLREDNEFGKLEHIALRVDQIQKVTEWHEKDGDVLLFGSVIHTEDGDCFHVLDDFDQVVFDLQND